MEYDVNTLRAQWRNAKRDADKAFKTASNYQNKTLPKLSGILAEFRTKPMEFLTNTSVKGE